MRRISNRKRNRNLNDFLTYLPYFKIFPNRGHERSLKDEQNMSEDLDISSRIDVTICGSWTTNSKVEL